MFIDILTQMESERKKLRKFEKKKKKKKKRILSMTTLTPNTVYL